MTSIILVKWVFHWLRSVSFCRKITFDFFLMDAWLGNGRRVEVYETVEVERYKRKVMSYMTILHIQWYINDTQLGQKYAIAFRYNNLISMRMMYGDCRWLQSNSRSLTWFRGRALLSPCRKLLNLPWNSLASNDDRFISRNQSQAPRRPVGSFSVENHPSEKPATCVLTTWTVGRGQLETEYRAPPNMIQT